MCNNYYGDRLISLAYRFSRRIMGGNRGQDFDLNREYYLLLGTGDTLAGMWVLDGI